MSTRYGKKEGLSSHPARDLREADPTGWSFLISRRWAGYLGLVVVFAFVCVCLGFWQLGRHEDAVAQVNLVAANYDAAPVPVDQALAQFDSYDDATQEWLSVQMTGHYLVADQLLVRNRPLDGNPGFEVLTPLQLPDGSVFVVDRGWLPTGENQDSPDVVPAPPSGQVTVVARLKAGEPPLAGRSAPPGQIATIELPAIQQQLGAPVYTAAYGLVDTENPSVADMPTAVEKPIPDLGPYLSYTVQWFLFALLAFVALGYAARQEYRSINAEDPEEQARAAVREAKRRAKAKSDAEVEDDILDHQH